MLLANMDKLKGLTKKIHGSLGRLDNSGRNVQAAIRPIYGNTSKLQVTNANIDKINHAINNIRQPLDRRRKEEDVIRAGLGRVDLNDYLASMDRAGQALENLRQTNLKSNQEAMAELIYILKFGTNELEGAFRDTLQQEAIPVEPLRHITKNQPFPTISEQNSSKLRVINSYMSNSPSQRNPTSATEDPKSLQIYAEVRGQYIATSLQNLAAASVSTVRKTDASAIYRQGTSGIGTYATALEQMFGAEYDNICPIFSREQWTRLHSLTTNDSAAQLFNVLRDLHSHIKNHIITDCFLAFEIVDIVTGLSFRLEAKNSELRQPIQDALRPIRETAKYSLSRLYDDARQRVGALMTLPADGSVVPLTTETMNRLQSMIAYLSPLSSILASVGDGGWRSGTSSNSTRLDVGVDGNELFSVYCDDTISVLVNGLETKAKGMLKSKSHMGVFIANNVSVVERMIFTSDLSTVLTDSTRNKLNTWMKHGVSLYTDAFKEPASFLRDAVYTNRTSGSGGARPPSNSISGGADSGAIVKGMSSKDRDATKEKFKNFNQTFDEVIVRCRGLRMEGEVRDMMIKEVLQFVEPLYDRFWDRYHELDKGRGKYVKYDKAQLRSTLQNL